MLDISMKKKTINYLIATLSILVFGIIYEVFSFGVISYFMVLAFTFPLFGMLIYLLASRFKKGLNSKFMLLFDSSIATFTLGFIVKGVIEIFGTTNKLTLVFFIVGGMLFLLSLLFYFVDDKK